MGRAKKWTGLAAAVAALGCPPDDAAGPRDERTGVYRYTATVSTGGPTELHLAGTLTITGVTPDGVTGTWSVPEFDPPVFGFWHDRERAYLLSASGTPESGILAINHYVTWSGAGVSCRGRNVTGGNAAFPVECTLVRR